ncbi:HAD-IIB family hydrolase [Longibaculum muris]|uniref:HAD-IIB family hydrolase n=1 Tax=Longibaculum muris TaxID=1796628 RepID=UPI0012B7857E|nr:HAD-IIB family hydrolase [Longibaculum muris]
MDKKYFFFDIDGTLTNKETGEIVESAKMTIQQLQAQGHFVCIATGRAYYKTKEFAKKMGIHHIVSNGGAALTINDELIENRPLDHQLAVQLCYEADRLGYGILISPRDSLDVVMKDERFIEQIGYRQEPTRYILNRSMKFEDIENIYKIYIAISPKEEDRLTLKDSLGHIRFMPGCLTYQHDEKDQGILKMIERVNGKKEDVVVFGDDFNDLVMFKKEWTNIAMGNACEPLKAQATFVTKASVDDGIEYACRHFGWIL